MSLRKKKIKEWEKLAKKWAFFKEPYKPGKKGKELYKKSFLKYSPGKRVIVLGATPELVDVLAELKCDITLIDQSPIMIKAMKSLRKVNYKEKVIIKNWFDYKPERKYDAVFGDTTINNIHLSSYDRYHEVISSWLKKKGVFITDVAAFFNTKTPKYDYYDLIKHYRKNPRYFENFTNKAYIHYFLWNNYKSKDGWIHVWKIDDDLGKFVKKRIITKKEYNEMRMPLMWQGSVVLGSELKLSINKFYNILLETIEDDHPVFENFYRYYVLQPKWAL